MGAGELNFALWKMLRLGTTGKADEGKAGSRKCGSMSEYNMNRQDPKTRKTGNKIRMCRKIRTCRRKISKKNQQQKNHEERISNEIGTGNTRREDRAARTHKGKFNNRHQTSSVVHTQPETGCYRAALVELPESPRVPAETGLTHLISML